jgi:DNA-binding NarL/FixJ family response regulator
LQGALLGIANHQPNIVLLDQAFPCGLAAVGRIRAIAPQIPVVVMAVGETSEEVISWAEAGAAGYIPRTAGLAEIVPLLVDIRGGSQPCSASVAGGLLRRLSNGGIASSGNTNVTFSTMLTTRETQIAQMIAEGMSNKDIARRLNIGLTTTKTHVHHLLGKLNLQRRGQAASWIRDHTDH